MLVTLRAGGFAVHPIADLQIEYSLISRGIEDDILATCRDLDIAVTAYGVLSRGLISGHWTKQAGSAGDWRMLSPRFQDGNVEANLKLVEKLRAIADANEAYARAPADMTALIAEWSGQDDKVIHTAQERMNPTTHLTQAQAQKWWDFIGSVMVERGELSPKVKPFPDVFDLSFQAS